MVLTIALFAQAARERSHARAFASTRDCRTQAARVTLAGEFTASIGDAMAEPLSTMLGNVATAELLLDDPDSNAAALASLLSEIKSDNLRASKIVRHWLDVARHGRSPAVGRAAGD